MKQIKNRVNKLKIKKWFFLVFLLIPCNMLFPLSPNRESFRINNFSSKNVVVNTEFWEEAGGVPEFNYMWEQNVCGLELIIDDILSAYRTNIIRPGESRTIVGYFPNVFDQRVYDQMFNLPFDG